jgi:hypothetical protein
MDSSRIIRLYRWRFNVVRTYVLTVLLPVEGTLTICTAPNGVQNSLRLASLIFLWVKGLLVP